MFASMIRDARNALQVVADLLQVERSEVHDEVGERIRVLIAHLDERRAAGRQLPRRDIDDLPDVAKPVISGHQRQRGLVLANFGCEILVFRFGHVRRIGQDEVERAFGVADVGAFSERDAIGDAVALGVGARDIERRP